MTLASDGDELTRVGSGTIMGEFMRQYWIPALMSREIERNSPPIRLLLLGERLIAFRDDAGRVGIFDHRCPHRCASLFLGRNEADGLRCVYHGWKYDTEGNCIDMPNLLPEQDFRNKVKAKAYQVVERNGLIWVYMGRRASAPPLPMFEVAMAPEAEHAIAFTQRECNWLQAMEGDIDTSHFGFLHAGHLTPEKLPSGHPLLHTLNDRAPAYHMAEMPWGTSYGAYRPGGTGRTYWRFANFLFPFWTQQPAGDFRNHVHARAWVPMDDTHTMFMYLSWEKGAVGEARNEGNAIGATTAPDHVPNDSGWYGRWRTAGNPTNDWLIDRAAQREGRSYSGVGSIQGQDQAVTESMGPISDHGFEHLAPSDLMIARTRRRILQAARAFRDAGTTGPGVDEPEVYAQARSGNFLADAALDWQAAYAEQMEGAVRLTGDHH
jgi:phthalate 4,5-dioxygenase